MVGKPSKKPSKAYQDILAYINATPDLISLLYDLNLLPEVVQDDPHGRREMIACYFGYRAGKSEV